MKNTKKSLAKSMSSEVGPLEIIDGLCSVTEKLAQLVKKQAEVIAQSDIAEEVKAELEAMKKETDDNLDILEYRMRRL